MSKSAMDKSLVWPILQKIEQASSEEELNKILAPHIIKAYRENAGLVEEANEIEEAMAQRRIILSGNSTMQTEDWLKKFVTQDKEMILMKSKIRKLSRVDDPVLIQGETGTGKELLARALHGNRKGKVIALNCAGMPEHLIESELFGHVRGAFTDAKDAKVGLMKAATDGTLFLDEIGELKITLQAKLLRAIQEKRIRRVGSNDDESINCRFIAATHHDLKKLVSENNFRKDLYYRLAIFKVQTKPLRERVEDITLIIDSLTTDEKKRLPAKGLEKFHFDGNVRDLQSMIRRYTVLDELPDIPE